MALELIQNAFNKGEWSPRLDGRSDLEGYYGASRIMENMFATRYGPAERRPGLQFVAEVKDSTKLTRLLPFKFSTVQAYIIETGNQYFRFFKDRGQILASLGTEDLSSLDNIVAHWKLNDDAATTAVVDADGATHNGVLYKADNTTENTDQVTDTDGSDGANNSFDMSQLTGGSGMVEVADSADFSFDDSSNEPATLHAWVKPASVATKQDIISKWTNSLREWRLYMNSSGKIVFEIFDESAGVGAKIVSDNSINADTWAFIVVTYNGVGGSLAANGMKLYIDQVLAEVTRTNNASYVAMENLTSTVEIGGINGKAQILIKQSDGTAIGDMTDGGGLAAAFDEDNSQDAANGAQGNPATSVIPIYIGKDWGAGVTHTITGFKAWGATSAGTDQGFVNIANPTVTIMLQGSTDNFSGSIVDLGSASDTDANSLLISKLTGITTTTAYRYHRLKITHDEGGIARQMYCAECEFYDTGGSTWTGKLDNVAVFSDVLTADEIDALEGTAELPYEISSPYLEADLFGIQRIQSADVVYAFHSGYNPRKLLRFDHDRWKLESIEFDWPTFVTENKTDITITPMGTGAPGLTVDNEITLIASSAIFTEDHVGSHWLIKYPRIGTEAIQPNKIKKTFGAVGDSDILKDVKGSWKFRTAGAWTGVLEIQRSYDEGITWHTLGAFESKEDQNFDVPGEEELGDAWLKVVCTTYSNAIEVILTVERYYHYGIVKIIGFADTTHVTANVTRAINRTSTYTNKYAFVDGAGGADTITDADSNFLNDGFAANQVITVSGSADNNSSYTIVSVVAGTITLATGVLTAEGAGPSVTIGIATKLWSEGAWSDERGYPASGTFHEERLMLGGTVHEPNRLDGSKTNEWENFRSDSVLDDDSILYFLTSNEVNAIKWLISKEALLMGTTGAEWKLGAFDTGEPLTPGNPTVPRVQTTYGSKGIQAIMLANIVLFVVGGQSENSEGRVVRGAQFVFEKGESGSYDAFDYTTLAEHITESGIVSMAYQQQPEPVLWCVLNNGKLVGMTFEPGQKIWGWFNVITDGEFEDVAVIPGVSEDEVWVIVKRTLPDGTVNRNIEYFKPRDWGSDQKDVFFVDSGLSFDGGAAVTITGITQADPAVVTMSTYPTNGDGDNIADGDQIRIRYVGGMGEVRNTVFTVSNPNTGAKTFELRDSLDTVDINSTAFTAYKASISGDTTYDSFDVTNVSAADIAALALGSPITGTGIPDNTTITEIGDDRFTMSARATVTDTTVTITIAGNVEQVDNTFAGLGHLEGKTVSVCGDGTVHGDVVVSSATVSLTEFYNKVHVGLPYESKLKLMKIELQTPRGSMRGKIKKIDNIIFSFHKTLGAKFGTTEGTNTIPFRKTTDATGQAVPLFTGEKQMSFPGGYELDGDVFVSQKQPLPLTVRTIISSLKIYD